MYTGLANVRKPITEPTFANRAQSDMAADAAVLKSLVHQPQNICDVGVLVDAGPILGGRIALLVPEDPCLTDLSPEAIQWVRRPTHPTV